MLADHLQKSLARAVIVENRPGAGGRVGARAVKEAAPDGATLLFAPSGLATAYPHVYANLGYDPLVDLLPIIQVVKFDQALVVGGKLPVRSVAELVAWLKANPDQATFGSPGAGGSVHFAGMEFGRFAKLDLRHVAYKGTPAALPDLMTGRLPMYIASVAEFIEHHKAGTIRILATLGASRLASCRMSRRCGRAASTSRHRIRSRCGFPQARPRLLPNACASRSSTP
jgi:tripartite-type tricarboxylate transporter receptor subunit TctC